MVQLHRLEATYPSQEDIEHTGATLPEAAIVMTFPDAS